MSLATPDAPLVLLIEDEPPMRKFLRNYLLDAGYRLVEAVTGQEGLQLAAKCPPAAIILDLGLPDLDGQDVLLKLRQWLRAPIIVLSAREQDVQKIAALDHGADDYLTKPFSPGELLARVRAALRRAESGQGSSELPVFESGNLKVDFQERKVLVDSVEVRLTPLEFKLLAILVNHSGRVVTHEFLLSEVWGAKRLQNKSHLRVFMAGLRRKIESNPAQPRYLLTEQGVGYRLASE